MKKIITLALTLILAFTFVLTLVPSVYAEGPTATVDVELYLWSDTEDFETTLPAPYGQEFEVDASAFLDAGERFVAWVVDGVRVNNPEDTAFVATSDMKLSLIFAPEDEYAAVFVDTNGHVIDVVYVAAEEPVVAPSPLPDKPNFVLASPAWDKELGTISEDTFYKIRYQLHEDTQFSIDVDGGSASNDEPTYNDVVTLTPADPENFVAWLEDGQVVSFDPNYKFSALSDRDFEASNDELLLEAPLVTLLGALELRDGYESFLGQVQLPGGWELVEVGLLLSDIEAAPTYATATKILKSSAIHPVTGEFLRSIADENMTEFVRAYAVVKDAFNVLSTIYSDETVGATLPVALQDHFRVAGLGSGYFAIEVNRVGAASPYNIRSNYDNVEGLRVFVFDNNNGTPLASNAIAYMDIRYNGTDNTYVYVNGNFAQSWALANGNSNVDMYEQPWFWRDRLQHALGVDYSASSTYYFAMQVIAREGGTFTGNSVLSDYTPRFFSETTPLTGAGQPVHITTGYAYPWGGNGYVPVALNRADLARPYIGDENIDYLMVYVHDSNANPVPITTFRVYGDKTITTEDGLEVVSTTLITGSGGGMEFTAANFKALLETLLDTDYDVYGTYYLKVKLFISENSIFSADSSISGFAQYYWQEMIPAQEKPVVSYNLFYVEGGAPGGSFAIAINRVNDGNAPAGILTLHNSEIAYMNVFIYTSTNSEDLVGSFRFYANKTITSADGATTFAGIEVAGGGEGMYILPGGIINLLTQVLGVYDSEINHDGYQATETYFFAVQYIVNTPGVFAEDSDITAIRNQYFRETN